MVLSQFAVIVTLLPFACSRRVHNERNALAEPLGPDETEIIFIRHGISLNNVFKSELGKNIWDVMRLQIKTGVIDDFEHCWNASSTSNFKRGYSEVCCKQKLCGNYSEGANSSISWELWRNSRDCLLHPDGESSAFQLQQTLLNLLPPDYQIDGFYTSPLRRTLQTLLTAFGDFMIKSPRSRIGVQPWAHEQYKSASDLGNDGDLNAHFLERYAAHMHHPPHDAIAALQRDLLTLGPDWVDKYGKVFPEGEELGPALDEQETFLHRTMPFYPRGSWFGTYQESTEQLHERMVILRRWFQRLPSGGRYVLSSHGAISEALFGRKLDNLGIVVARFKKGSFAEDGEHFFSQMQLGRDLWQSDAIPGWHDEGHEDSNTNDDEEVD